jgi:Restriction endonuclease/ATP cone domain
LPNYILIILRGDTLEVFVTKEDGSRQLFDKEKVVRTCVRMGANSYVAQKVAEKVEKKLYDGIQTRMILRMIFRFMRKYKPAVHDVFDLKKGLSLMSPKPEFEHYIQVLLMSHGFEVKTNQILRGKCVEHEVDAIAKKDGITFFVEAKHHLNYHTLTGLDESRIARAVLEDIIEGFALGRCDLKIDRAMIVTNTRYSEHAIQYGGCRNIFQIGWNSPENFGLQNMISEKKLYPLSCLKGLSNEHRLRLVNAGIVIIGELLSEDSYNLSRRTNLSQDAVEKIREKARSISNAVGFY